MKNVVINGNNKGGIVAILAILSIVIPVLTAQAALAQSAYSRGYSDARCDKNFCHGHGFDPSCPSGHSGDFCANYAAGYRAGWNAGSGGGGGGYDVGHKDGQNHPFSQEKFSKYGDSYLRGFMDGCMSVPGNTRAACNSATDAG